MESSDISTSAKKKRALQRLAPQKLLSLKTPGKVENTTLEPRGPNISSFERPERIWKGSAVKVKRRVGNIGLNCRVLYLHKSSNRIINTRGSEARRAEGLIIINSEVEDRGINVGFVLL